MGLSRAQNLAKHPEVVKRQKGNGKQNSLSHHGVKRGVMLQAE